MKQRLSFTTLDLLHSCERKYQIEKLLAGSEREESEHLSFGTAYGAAVATYLETQDADQAIWALFLAYKPTFQTDKKSMVRCVQAFLASQQQLDTLLDEWELVYFNGKPAIELSFRIDVDEDYYYVGYIDAVVRNRFTGIHCVFECKTTGLLLSDLSPAYKHSGQALGYSVVLDRICGEDVSSYSVLYWVCQLGKGFSDITIQVFVFKKTLLDRLNWFIVLGLDVKHLHEMRSLQIYPRRYTACLRFNKPCRHFGTCQLHSLDIPKPPEEDLLEYQFCYQLQDLVTDHLRRIQTLPAELQEVRDVVDFSMDAGSMVDLDSPLDMSDLVALPSPSSRAIPQPVVPAVQPSRPPAKPSGASRIRDLLAARAAAKGEQNG